MDLELDIKIPGIRRANLKFHQDKFIVLQLKLNDFVAEKYLNYSLANGLNVKYDVKENLLSIYDKDVIFILNDIFKICECRDFETIESYFLKFKSREYIDLKNPVFFEDCGHIGELKKTRKHAPAGALVASANGHCSVCYSKSNIIHPYLFRNLFNEMESANSIVKRLHLIRGSRVLIKGGVNIVFDEAAKQIYETKNNELLQKVRDRLALRVNQDASELLRQLFNVVFSSQRICYAVGKWSSSYYTKRSLYASF